MRTYVCAAGGGGRAAPSTARERGACAGQSAAQRTATPLLPRQRRWAPCSPCSCLAPALLGPAGLPARRLTALLPLQVEFDRPAAPVGDDVPEASSSNRDDEDERRAQLVAPCSCSAEAGSRPRAPACSCTARRGHLPLQLHRVLDGKRAPQRPGVPQPRRAKAPPRPRRPGPHRPGRRRGGRCRRARRWPPSTGRASRRAPSPRRSSRSRTRCITATCCRPWAARPSPTRVSCTCCPRAWCGRPPPAPGPERGATYAAGHGPRRAAARWL